MTRFGPTATRPTPRPTTSPDAWLGRLRSDRWLGAGCGAEGGACAMGLGGYVEKQERPGGCMEGPMRKAVGVWRPLWLGGRRGEGSSGYLSTLEPGWRIKIETVPLRPC